MRYAFKNSNEYKIFEDAWKGHINGLKRIRVSFKVKITCFIKKFPTAQKLFDLMLENPNHKFEYFMKQARKLNLGIDVKKLVRFVTDCEQYFIHVKEIKKVQDYRTMSFRKLSQKFHLLMKARIKGNKKLEFLMFSELETAQCNIGKIAYIYPALTKVLDKTLKKFESVFNQPLCIIKGILKTQPRNFLNLVGSLL